VFGTRELYDPEVYDSTKFDFSAENFHISNVYNYYKAKSKRYPIEAFTDMFLFDSL